MIKKILDQIVQLAALQWRALALFCVLFFLVMSVLATFVIAPNITTALNKSKQYDLELELQLEAELFMRFIDSQKSILENLAKYPSVANAVMLADGTRPNLIDLLNNTNINDEKGKFVLQDIEGNILLKTSDNIHPSYTVQSAWIDKVVSGQQPFHFQLLSQSGDSVFFKITVPVVYNGHNEGLLSAELDASLRQIFVTHTFGERIGFKLSQNNVVVQTDMEFIKVPKEISKLLEAPNV